MTEQAQAEEHLRVIRSLMEKATVYRAISAPGALVGGCCSLVMTALALGSGDRFFPASGDWSRFAIPWLAVLTCTAFANLYLLWRDAQRRGESFVSAGMRLALRAMLPALLAGALCTLFADYLGWPTVAALWVLLYGVSLLAASHFAPTSICWLGRAFFAAGVVLVLAAAVSDWWLGSNQSAIAHATMGGTFGLFHLIYAACTWPKKSPAAPATTGS